MAEGSRDLTVEEGLSELEVTCANCQKHYTEPKVLLCHPYYCRQCLTIRTKLPTANSFEQARKKEKVEVKCQLCLQDKAKAFCRQCVKLICADCIKAHMKMVNAFPDHEVFTLGGPSHSKCTNDNTPKIKQELDQRLHPLRESKTSLLRAMGSIYATISEVEDQGKSVAEHIESSFAELQQIIDNRKQELLAEATAIVEQKSQHLSEQEEGLSNACVAVESIIDCAEQCAEHLSDNDIVTVHANIQNEIKRLEEQQKEGKDLEPAEEVDLRVEVNCAQDLKQLCETKAEMTQHNVAITSEGPMGTAQVNRTSQFVVRTLINERPTKRSYEVKCCLKSPANSLTSDCRVQQVLVNKYPIQYEYRIQYTPTVLGHHELDVTVNGREVALSPRSSVFVTPKGPCPPVLVITELKDPRDVAVTTTGHIIVTESKNTAVFDKSGKKVKDLDLSKDGIPDPCGVAVDDSNGCIFITGRGNITLKLNREFTVVGTFRGWGCYKYLAVVGGEVMICDDLRKVVVFSKDTLEYGRDFDCKAGNIEGLCSGEDLNLYVCNGREKCVNVLSTSGELVRSFGRGADCVRKLEWPVGVCVAGQYVYVADNRGHCVLVFTTEGSYVMSFGQCSGNEGDFKNPCGVCACSKDGLVYVCDHSNNRVQAFKLVQ